MPLSKRQRTAAAVPFNAPKPAKPARILANIYASILSRFNLKADTRCVGFSVSESSAIKLRTYWDKQCAQETTMTDEEIQALLRYNCERYLISVREVFDSMRAYWDYVHATAVKCMSLRRYLLRGHCRTDWNRTHTLWLTRLDSNVNWARWYNESIKGDRLSVPVTPRSLVANWYESDEALDAMIANQDLPRSVKSVIDVYKRYNRETKQRRERRDAMLAAAREHGTCVIDTLTIQHVRTVEYDPSTIASLSHQDQLIALTAPRARCAMKPAKSRRCK